MYNHIVIGVFVSHEEENHWSWSIQMKSKNTEMMSSVMGAEVSELEINASLTRQIHSIIIPCF